VGLPGGLAALLSLLAHNPEAILGDEYRRNTRAKMQRIPIPGLIPGSSFLGSCRDNKTRGFVVLKKGKGR